MKMQKRAPCEAILVAGLGEFGSGGRGRSSYSDFSRNGLET